MLKEATRAESAKDAAEAKNMWDQGFEDTWEAYEEDSSTIDIEGFVNYDMASDAAIDGAWRCYSLGKF